MMSDFMAQPKRQPIKGLVQARHALALIKPFVARFEDWNHRAAKASATALSHVSTPTERSQQVQLLSAFYDEVDAAYNEFETVIAGEPPHSRIDDLRAAFLRLRSVLERWRAPTR